jgi:hypothetical protein
MGKMNDTQIGWDGVEEKRGGVGVGWVWVAVGKGCGMWRVVLGGCGGVSGFGWGEVGGWLWGGGWGTCCVIHQHELIFTE